MREDARGRYDGGGYECGDVSERKGSTGDERMHLSHHSRICELRLSSTAAMAPSCAGRVNPPAAKQLIHAHRCRRGRYIGCFTRKLAMTPRWRCADGSSSSSSSRTDQARPRARPSCLSSIFTARWSQPRTNCLSPVRFTAGHASRLLRRFGFVRDGEIRRWKWRT